MTNTAIDKFFMFLAETRPGLTHGVPYLAPVIESLKQLDRYTEAEVMAAVVSAMFGFVKSKMKKGLAPMTPTEGRGRDDGDYKFLVQFLDLQPGENIEIADPKDRIEAFDPFCASGASSKLA